MILKILHLCPGIKSSSSESNRWESLRESFWIKASYDLVIRIHLWPFRQSQPHHPRRARRSTHSHAGSQSSRAQRGRGVRPNSGPAAWAAGRRRGSSARSRSGARPCSSPKGSWSPVHRWVRLRRWTLSPRTSPNKECEFHSVDVAAGTCVETYCKQFKVR